MKKVNTSILKTFAMAILFEIRLNNNNNNNGNKEK